MNNLSRKKVLYGIQRFLLESNLSIDEINNLILSIESGEMMHMMRNILSSMRDVYSFDERIGNYNRPEANLILSDLIKKIEIKSIPERSIISFMRSLGFSHFRLYENFYSALEGFVQKSETKNLEKLIEFIMRYDGNIDPYLNAIKNDKK